MERWIGHLSHVASNVALHVASHVALHVASHVALHVASHVALHVARHVPRATSPADATLLATLWGLI
jgi:hypothetical protein